MSEELVTTQPSLTKPESLKAFSVELKRFIVKEELYTPIKGKNYVLHEGWQFAGASLGLNPVIESCERLERVDEVAYRATVAIYSGEKIVSRGVAICSDKESSKSSFDEYAIASMAQTRAVGKAYRLILGFLMKMAGYEATPSEEMPQQFTEQEVSYEPIQDPTECPDCGSQMKVRKNGKGSYCPNKYPLQNPACPPKPKSEVDERIMEELDNIK